MNTITNYEKLEELGRARLSRNFFMRDFLHSEIAAWHGLRNVPDNPERAMATGRMLCEHLLEPLQATFGRIHIRSGYRAPQVNRYGNQHKLNCADNEKNFGRHIWDQPDAQGGHGAMACVVVPWLVDHLEKSGSWTAMAWWIHDHLPYSSLHFFSKLGAFNIGWHERPERRIDSYAAPKGCLTQPGMANHGGLHADQYKGFPALVAAHARAVFKPVATAIRPVAVTTSAAFSPVRASVSAPAKGVAALSAVQSTAPTTIASTDGKVHYRAIHMKSKWRKANNHGSLNSAIYGPNGAAGLFAGKVRIDYTAHGDPVYVLAWQEGAQNGHAIKRDAADPKGIRVVSVPIGDLLGFDACGQASQSELERYFR